MRECSPPTMCYMSSGSGGTSRWRVCYQRGLPRLVSRAIIVLLELVANILCAGASGKGSDINTVHYVYQGENVSFLTGQETTFIRGKQVSLQLGPDTTFIRMGSVLAYSARPYNNYEWKCPYY